jgi:hypothetical protein
MVSKPTMSNTMRIYHRYLGYFLAGIMTIYATSGVIMIFRDTNFLKQDKQVEKKLAANLAEKELGEAIRVRDLKITAQNGDIASFASGTYNKVTGVANYTIKVWPEFINKLTGLHKASSKEPLFYLNVFFGISLLFFVVSAFWMFLPKTTIFRKGLYFTLAGVILTLIMLFI